MLELLQLIEAGLAVTAVSLAVVTAPVVVLTGSDPPDIQPLVDSLEGSALYKEQPKTP